MTASWNDLGGELSLCVLLEMSGFNLSEAYPEFYEDGDELKNVYVGLGSVEIRFPKISQVVPTHVGGKSVSHQVGHPQAPHVIQSCLTRPSS
jgi:hypothetical protein